MSGKGKIRRGLKGREGEGERVWLEEGRGSNKHRGSWEGASNGGQRHCGRQKGRLRWRQTRDLCSSGTEAPTSVS